METKISLQYSQEAANGPCLEQNKSSPSFRTLFFKICFNVIPVGIALGYGLDDRGSRVRFPVGAGNFPLHHRV
jgi:hypothetical protein